MPILFYVLIIFLLSISLRKNEGDYFLDKHSSIALKGFFVLLIVFSHILGYLPYNGLLSEPLSWFRAILGQLCVSFFFFSSGYGIIYSIETKGTLYSKTLITNRLLRIIIYAFFGILPFLIFSCAIGNVIKFQDILLSIIGLKSFGNASWFLFAILYCYFCSSIVFLFNWKHKLFPTLLITISVVAYIIISYFLQRPSYLWNTIICFPLGMFISLYRERINFFLSKQKKFSILGMIITFSGVILFRLLNIKMSYYFPSIIEMWFSNFFFCLFFVFLTKVFALKSKALSFIGKKSFAIFIVHMIVICVFNEFGQFKSVLLTYSLLFILCPLVGILFGYIYELIDKFLIYYLVTLNARLIKKDDAPSNFS